MKKTILLIGLVFLMSVVHAQQRLPEITKTFENGQPMFIDYLDSESLKKVETVLFNESGTKIFSMKFNPVNSLPDGEFFDLINKGFFKNGILTCEKCVLVEANEPSIYTYNKDRMETQITTGDVINGVLVGEIKHYAVHEETFNRIDWESSRRAVSAGAWVGFRDVKTYTTGVFNKTLIDTKKYNTKGVLEDGETILKKGGWRAKLVIKNGIVRSYVSRDFKGMTIDSLSNEAKIWKINGKLVRNNGFLVFNHPENFNEVTKTVNYDGNRTKYGPISYSNYNFKIVKSKGVLTLKGTHPRGLNSNGIYSEYKTGLLDKIIEYDTDIKDESIVYFDRKFSNTKEQNLFTLIYNFLVNGDEKLIDRPFFAHYNSPERLSSCLPEFVKYLETTKNNFSKYLKSTHSDLAIYVYDEWGTLSKHNTILWKGDRYDEYIGTLGIPTFFAKVIGIDDYLKACNESIVNKETQIQEILVWDTKTLKYEKVDFSRLIQLAKQKQMFFEQSVREELKRKENQEVRDILFTMLDYQKRYLSGIEKGYSSKIKNVVRDSRGNVNSVVTPQLFFERYESFKKTDSIVKEHLSDMYRPDNRTTFDSIGKDLKPDLRAVWFAFNRYSALHYTSDSYYNKLIRQDANGYSIKLENMLMSKYVSSHKKQIDSFRRELYNHWAFCSSKILQSFNKQKQFLINGYDGEYAKKVNVTKAYTSEKKIASPSLGFDKYYAKIKKIIIKDYGLELKSIEDWYAWSPDKYRYQSEKLNWPYGNLYTVFTFENLADLVSFVEDDLFTAVYYNAHVFHMDSKKIKVYYYYDDNVKKTK
tara:strand:- start:438 stop:2873 length:2436 start_codon:yes stop_codon:yes gene_type:complete